MHRYEYDRRTIFHGGLCDRWETEKPADLTKDDPDAFTLRSRLLDTCVASKVDGGRLMGDDSIPAIL